MDTEADLHSLSTQQLRHEKQSISSQLLHVQQQISDLAYRNYRTYADAGSTTEYCRKAFGEANQLVDSINSDIDNIRNCLRDFGVKGDEVKNKLNYLKMAESKDSPLWDILSLPARMDVCIRAGYYGLAFSITNYGVQLQQQGLTDNSTIKTIADRLIDARYYLLEELFNRFTGPIELADSIQVVNNIRKIPFLSPTQLRFTVLQYRDSYLEKLIYDIKNQPDFVLRMVEVYRDFMYDTIVLYLAAFPENELTKRDPAVDPRWDIGQVVNSSTILSDWALHKLNSMFDIIRKADVKSDLDLGALSNKLMSFGLSFGRMGMDFRPSIINIIGEVVFKKFSKRLDEATTKFTSCENISIIGGVPEVLSTFQNELGAKPSPPSVLAVWDDLCLYGNELLEGLNDLRNGLSINLLNNVLEKVRGSVTLIFAWLDKLAGQQEHQDSVVKAIRLLDRYFVPYMNSCLLLLFPYEKCCRPFLHSAFTLQQYEKRCALVIRDLYADCSNISLFDEICKPLDVENLQPEEIDLKPTKDAYEESAVDYQSVADLELEAGDQADILEISKGVADSFISDQDDCIDFSVPDLSKEGSHGEVVSEKLEKSHKD